MSVQFRKHFGYDVEAASNAAVVDPATYGPSLTVQAHSDDADINNLMRRMRVIDDLNQNPNPPTYADFTEITDFRSAIAAVADAAERFNAFPANVRAQFDNDPQKMLEFVANRDNLDKAIDLGLCSDDVVKARAKERQAVEDARQAELLAVAKKAGYKIVEAAPKTGAPEST